MRSNNNSPKTKLNNVLNLSIRNRNNYKSVRSSNQSPKKLRKIQLNNEDYNDKEHDIEDKLEIKEQPIVFKGKELYNFKDAMDQVRLLPPDKETVREA